MKETGQESLHLREILSHFALQGGIAGIATCDSGHIHDTYQVQNSSSEFPDYLLQRINHHVFRNVPALMENIQLVTTHLRKKLKAIPGADPGRETLTLIPTLSNETFYQDKDGNFWRVYLFLKNTRSYSIVETVQQAYEGGKAFGRFLALLSDLDAGLLHESIPDFHNVENRLQLFEEAIARDKVNRVKEVSEEIRFVQQRAETMRTIRRLGRAGKLPLRITHNDTKFNNVLLDEQDKAQCVIDLDTVMPGYVAYDFGDAIRTTIITTAEDEKDLEKIGLNIPLFEGFTKGFLRETSSFLTDAEIDSLAYGVTLLPYIMGLRFLTDYIDGDHYYKIHFPDHNLQRARAQFRLVELLEENLDTLTNIIREIADSHKMTNL